MGTLMPRAVADIQQQLLAQVLGVFADKFRAGGAEAVRVKRMKRPEKYLKLLPLRSIQAEELQDKQVLLMGKLAQALKARDAKSN